MRARAPEPERELRVRPDVAARDGQPDGSRAIAAVRSRSPASQACSARAAAAGASRCSSPGLDRVPPGLVERRAGRRLRPPRLEPAERDERGADADPEVLAEAERRARVGLRLRPRAVEQPQVGADAEQVLLVALEVVLAGERQAALEVRGRAGVVRPPQSVAVVRLTSARAAWSCSPAATASSNASSSCSRPCSCSARPTRTVPTLVSAWASVARSPSRRARSIARVPSAIASASRLGVHRQLGLAAERHRELAAGRQRLEQRDRLLARARRLLAAARPPQQARQPAEARAGGERVAGRTRAGRGPRGAPRAHAPAGRTGTPRPPRPRAPRRRRRPRPRAPPPSARAPRDGRPRPPRRGRRRAPSGAIASASPAASAWWASRVTSAPGRARARGARGR